MARKDTPQSASTMLREQQDPAVRLGLAVERYMDALRVAAEEVIGPSAMQALEGFADRLVPGLTDEPAWPTLRTHLLLLAADGADPHQRLQAAHDARQISSADDRAAVLDWRLEDASLLRGRDGPLPWLPGIPHRITANPTWGPCLSTRSDLVAQLAGQVRRDAAAHLSAWAAQLHTLPSAELIADIQVWRAAIRVDPVICDPPGHPSSAVPTESSNSNSTGDSPSLLRIRISDGGNCWPQKSHV